MKHATHQEHHSTKQLAALLIGLVLAALAVHAAARPNVIVSGFSIEPEASPGKDATIVLTLKNTEPSSCAKAVTVSFAAPFPFVMKGVSTAAAGDICAGDEAKVSFPVHVDATATAGFYQVTATATFESVLLDQFSTASTINVQVGGSPELTAFITSSDPIDVYAGDSATVTVTIENDGSFQAESVNATLHGQPPVEVKWAKSFYATSLLGAKESTAMDFAIEVPKDAKAGAYPLGLVVSYSDERKETRTKAFRFPFKVKEKARYEAADDGSGLFYANYNGMHAKLLLKNVGSDAGRKVTARLIPQFPFSADGSSRYVEFLDTGKAARVDYTVNVDKDGKPGTYSLDLLVNWEDAAGKKFQDTATVALTIQEKGTMRAVFLDYWFVWLAVILVILLVVSKRMKKRKK